MPKQQMYQLMMRKDETMINFIIFGHVSAFIYIYIYTSCPELCERTYGNDHFVLCITLLVMQSAM